MKAIINLYKKVLPIWTQRLCIAISVVISSIAVLIGSNSYNPAEDAFGWFLALNIPYWLIVFLACWVYDGKNIQKQKEKSFFHKTIFEKFDRMEVEINQLQEDVGELAEYVQELDSDVETIKDVLSDQANQK
jgi:hypothetical protein